MRCQSVTYYAGANQIFFLLTLSLLVLPYKCIMMHIAWQLIAYQMRGWTQIMLEQQLGNYCHSMFSCAKSISIGINVASLILNHKLSRADRHIDIIQSCSMLFIYFHSTDGKIFLSLSLSHVITSFWCIFCPTVTWTANCNLLLNIFQGTCLSPAGALNFLHWPPTGLITQFTGHYEMLSSCCFFEKFNPWTIDSTSWLALLISPEYLYKTVVILHQDI